MENPQNNSNRPLRFQTPIAVLAIAAMILIIPFDLAVNGCFVCI